MNATPCFDNPLRHHSSSVQRVLDMFWTRGPESFTDLAELTQEMRCKDPWLSAMLRECRTGSLQWEMYCFFHGLATEHPGSWMPETQRPSCGNRRCLDLGEGTWAEMRRQGCSWEERCQLECVLCRTERVRRARVQLSPADLRHQTPRFAGAPFVHPFNAAKYVVSQQRAIRFAQTHRRILLWVVAHDKPKTAEDAALKGSALQARRERWLRLHDKQTAGIMGLFPCVRDLPVRFTETVDREKGIFKNSRGVLKGWELSELDAQRVTAATTAEVCLCQRPRFLYVQVAGEPTWVVSKDLGKGVFPLKPWSRPWACDKKGLAKVSRLGFHLVPDFGGAVHSCTDCNLEADIADCLPWDKKPRREDQLRGYIALSRVEFADRLLVAQPFSPWLFRQGELPGPHLLLEFWRGNLTQEALVQEWTRRAEARLPWKGVDDMPLRCWRCSERAGKETVQPLKSVATENACGPWG